MEAKEEFGCYTVGTISSKSKYIHQDIHDADVDKHEAFTMSLGDHYTIHKVFDSREFMIIDNRDSSNIKCMLQR